jgi:hypothetical protein
MASRRSPPQRASSAWQAASVARDASIKMKIWRWRSFALVPDSETMRLEYVRPSLTMIAVDSEFRIIFWAVAALSLVEPAIASGPVSTSRLWSASSASGADRLLPTSTVSAPAARAARSAPATYGVRPLADNPTATSAAVTWAAAWRPSDSLSSAPSAACATASWPPA